MISLRTVGISFVVIFIAFILSRGSPPAIKPSHIPAFSDIPDDIWRSALEVLKHQPK